MSRLFLSLGLGAALWCAATPSHAEDAPAAEAPQQAEALFAKGRSLLATPGKLDEACATLEQSQALMNRGDTLLNLAECHRRQGRTASAWREFGQAIELAREAKFGDAIQVAKQRHADLESKLSFLTISVPPATAALAGFEVTLNGYAVPHDAWGKAVPVDPGTFAIAAKAEGRLPFSETRQVGPEGDKRDITVMLLPLPPTPVASPPAPVAPPPRPPPSNADAYVAVSLAGAGVVLAVSFGIAALRERGSSSDGSVDRETTYATVSAISFAAAVVAGITGTAMLVQNRRPSTPPAKMAKSQPRPFFVPLVGPQGGGAAVVLTF